MNKPGKQIIVSLLIGCTLIAGAVRANTTAPARVIFDTDMSGDCDDCGALALLNKLSDMGEARILACVANSRERQNAVAASISAINTYYGRPDIPIGTYHGSDGALIGSAYAAELRDKFPHHALPDDQEPAALDVYRTALAAAPDRSVTVVSVGFFCNLRDLLRSKPDALSPLSGPELIRAKVKQLVVMGGRFPASDPDHGEYNFSASIPLDTKFVVSHWPTPILFSGFEIGISIITGKSLASTPATNPVRRAYELAYGNCVRNGRPSWDLTAALAAVRDPRTYWNLSPAGTCDVSNIGTNTWNPQPDTGRTYLIRKLPPTEIARILDNLITSLPARENRSK